jgi:hypothetical protein
MAEAAFEVSVVVETLILARKLSPAQVDQFKKNASRISNSSKLKADHVGPQKGVPLPDKEGMILHGHGHGAFDVYVGALGRANLIFIRQHKKVPGQRDEVPQDWVLIGR